MTKETENGRESVPQYVVDALEKREAEHKAILDGLLPRLEQLFEGAPFYKDSIEADIQVFVDDLLAERRKIAALERLYKLPKNFALDAVKRMRDTCKPEAFVAVRELLDRLDHPDLMRLDVYLACSRDDKARERLAEHLDDGDWFMSSGLSVADGSLFRSFVKWGLQFGRAETMHHYCMRGFRSAKSQSDYVLQYVNGTRALEDRHREEAQSKLADLKADADFLERVMEDRGEIRSAPGLIVVPALPDGGTAWRKELTKSWKGLAGEPLPLVERGDVVAQRRQLVETWPHAGEIIDIILSDLAASPTVRFRPTLLVGDPGSGKSSLVRALCDVVGLPVELYSLAAVHDASLMGTSAQWSSARESTPLQLIKRSGKASVGVIWDEVEKVGTRTENGNALEALLPLLEVDQARRIRDLALEVEVDLSAVSHFATANSLEGIPDPLKDRMRVLTMPTPGWEHIGTLSRQIIDRVAKERGIDPRFFEPLAQDEIDLIKQAWPGGSLRQLTRIVTTILDGREQIMGRA